MSYRIKTVAQLTGISRNTITAWERRYGLLSPGRNASGYRVYSEADVALLRRVKSMTDAGYQISEVLAMFEAESAPPPAQRAAHDNGVDALRAQLLQRLFAFDHRAAGAVHSTLLALPYQQRIDTVYRPMLQEAGDRWERGDATVAQEHAASAFVRAQLVTMLQALDHGPTDGPRVVCAGIPGEQHELGLLAVSVQLALAGHQVVYMGANLPLDDLVQTTADTHADLVCQSVTQPRDPEELWAYVTELRRRLPSGVVVALGGVGAAPLAERQLPDAFVCVEFDDLASRLSELKQLRMRSAGK